ncbi:MAG: TadE/TadG family type IV pilus assembly protein [Actinomycetota bacterium]
MEFALVLPLLLLLVFGIIEFGFIFNRWVTVTHAAREGVRVLSLTGNTTDATEWAAAKLAAEEAAKATAPNIISDVTCTGGEDPPVPGSDERTVTMTCNTNYNLQLFVIGSNLTFGSTAKMRLET